MTDHIPAEFEVLDERFRGTGGDSRVDRLFGDGRWLEGPAYHPAGRFVLFSDIPNDRVLRWDEIGRRVDVFTAPAGFTNGRIVDRQGRFVTCEHGARRVTRLENDGSVTVLATAFDGLPLNAPNDVVEHSDGSLWFTDPAYGIDTDYEGHAAVPEQDGCHVYRLGPDGTLERAATDFDRPNGLAFSADERRLYVVDTPRSHIRVFDVADGALSDGGIFASADTGSFDGIRFDHLGRLWAAGHDGVHCFDPDGTLLGKLRLPEKVANLCFGGPQRNQLYITATTSLYSLRVKFRGATYPA